MADQDIIPDGVIRVTDHVIEVNAGETLTERDAVYVDASDDAFKCDASALSTIGFVGFVVAAATIGNTVRIRVAGHAGGFVGLTPNLFYYLSETAGAVTTTKPSNFKVVGRAVSTTVMKVVEEPTKRVRIYEADATWTKPANLIRVEIEAVGGGSGGKRTPFSDSRAPGGNAGAISKKQIDASDLAATEAISIGVAGTGQTSGASATVGGDTTFGTHLTAGGASLTTGGVATGGDINVDGMTSVQGSDRTDPYSFGANSPYGIGGRSPGGDATGSDGSGYGAGGGGSEESGSSGGGDGGDGSQGLLIVTEYY